MGETKINKSGYKCGYLDDNQVGEIGCRHLSKAIWGDLEVIELGIYSLTQAGIEFLTKAASSSAISIGRN